MKILFVCLGNICRSPAAEGIFVDLLKKEGLQSVIAVGSAGTSANHVGELPDKRMRSHAQKRGIILESRARQFSSDKDFREFDKIIVMDKSNRDNVLKLKGALKEKVSMMRDYCQELEAGDVPDPYYGGEEGFEQVLDILEDSCSGLLRKVRES